jgi:hypothetical protein
MLILKGVMKRGYLDTSGMLRGALGRIRRR